MIAMYDSNLRQKLEDLSDIFKLWINDNKSVLLVAISALVLTYQISSYFKKQKRNLPPGPFGLPVLGYLPFLTKNVHLKFVELGKKYGDIFSLKLGSQSVVVLNGAEAIREAFMKPEFLGRPEEGAFKIFDRSSPFFDSDNNIWREHRRFVVQSMKDLGLGKSRIEAQIQDEVNSFLNVLRSSDGKPIDLLAPLTPSMSNNICALVFDHRYDYEDPERKILDRNLNLGSEVIGQASHHIFMPWLRKVPFLLKWMNVQKGIKALNQSESIFRKRINEHKDTFDAKNIRDFIDIYLAEMNSRKENNKKTTLSDSFLIGSVSDLFGAGSETVRTSIMWSIYIMAARPDIQKQVQKEIMDKVGIYRNIEVTDQKQMPFTHAVTMEVMRWKTIVPLNILRCTLADTKVGGYDIPRGTTVMANLWAAHHDPKLWVKPETFMPERFLSPDGQSVIKSPNYMPFSIGKRACPGENMANMEVFLYFASIMQKFDVTFPEGTVITYDAQLGITLRPKTFLVSFVPRT